SAGGSGRAWISACVRNQAASDTTARTPRISQRRHGSVLSISTDRSLGSGCFTSVVTLHRAGAAVSRSPFISPTHRVLPYTWSDIKPTHAGCRRSSLAKNSKRNKGGVVILLGAGC